MIMKANKAIKILEQIEAKVEKIDNVDTYAYYAEIIFQNHTFSDYAVVHPEDKDYASDLVGYTIAHMRAIKKALIYLRDAAKNEYNIINKMVCDTLQNQDASVVDPTFRFQRKVYRAEKKWKDYKAMVETVQKQIDKYLKDQDKAITSIKRQRELKDKDN